MKKGAARWVRVAVLVLITLLALDAVDYERYLASSDQSPDTYPTLGLDGFQRLLVLAPHCDDEVLSAGGLIQEALEHGLDVRVVIVTAGDGYRRATAAEFGRPFPTSEDYIAMGERRQQESLDALTRLRLDADAVIFLTYPERGLAALWWDYWDGRQPYHSPYSRRAYNIYPRAFHSGAPYSGEVLLGDLRAILAAERPDLIVMPHQNDEHPDHQALSAFATLAVEMERAADPTFQPRLLGYLVHYGLYPQPFGLRPQDSLRPPRSLQAISDWQQVQLSTQELATKHDALDAYLSQQRVLGLFLNSFVRQNELYVEADAVTPLGIIESEVFPDVDSIQDGTILPGHADPVSDNVVRRVYRAADITSLHMIRVGDAIWVALEVRAPASRAICSYNLYVRAVSPEDSTNSSGHYGRVNTEGVKVRGHTIWYRLDLDALGNPDWLALKAETRQGVVLDHTAWYLVRL